jgi:hypothetical protein
VLFDHMMIEYELPGNVGEIDERDPFSVILATLDNAKESTLHKDSVGLWPEIDEYVLYVRPRIRPGILNEHLRNGVFTVTHTTTVLKWR